MGGAIDIKNKIISSGKAETFEMLVQDVYPEGITDGELNDYLWFGAGEIFAVLDIPDDDD